MDVRMQPGTEAGQRFAGLAEVHAKEAAQHADRHDREGTFPIEAFDAMKTSGFLTATVPEEFGGFGVASGYDLAVALSRLGQGDGSTAIAANMHLVFGLIAGRNLRRARARGDDQEAAAMEGYLTLLGSGAIGMANATEGGTDLLHPLVEATRVDGGWAIDGRKIFSTLSPIADLFFVPIRTHKEDGSWASGFAIVPRGTPGQHIHDNWDAVGMRASGSHDVVYENCVVPAEFVTIGEGWGEWFEDFLIIATVGNIGLLGAFLGIAESAHELAVDMARTRKKAPSGRSLAERSGIQHQVAESEADLATCRALVERVGRLIDHHALERPAAEVSIEELHELNREFQCAKLVVNRSCIDVVDRSLTASGGAGYLTSNVLSRLYRDVRAGPFMQPFSPNEAYEYIGQVAFGLTPRLDD
jgi:alkylation response protein AidB-like acyl-CoA dehydrogenase